MKYVIDIKQINIINRNKMSSESPNISVVSQYIKDLSFENPRAPDSLKPKDQPPEISVSLDLKVNPISSYKDTYEVSLFISADANSDSERLFLVEVEYAGVFTLINIPQEQHEIALAISCPSMIFPFARKIISDITQDSGFPPLRLDPVNFAKIYEEKLKEMTKN